MLGYLANYGKPADRTAHLPTRKSILWLIGIWSFAALIFAGLLFWRHAHGSVGMRGWAWAAIVALQLATALIRYHRGDYLGSARFPDAA